MITPALFKGSEVLRQKLAFSMDVLEVAFAAAQDELDARTTTEHDALAYSMAHAERRGIRKFCQVIRDMGQIPRENVGEIESNLNSIDPFDQLAVDAIKEHEQSLVVAKKTTKKSK